MSKIPEPGEQIGDRYRVVRLIGEGGMGSVYEAENLVTHKRVALKWLHPSIAGKKESTQRLIREARAASRIRHSNVVDVYDVVTTDEGAIFLVLELLDGEPLADVIDRGGMPAPQFIALLLQAMRGVSAAHQVGVIHRDVHPGNIFVERPDSQGAEVAKVLDFGISKIDTESSGHPLTQSGTTLGTPHYMSYEQLCASRDLDARADIYSFGVILYKALTGQFPFAAESLTELAVQLVTTKPVPVKALQRAVPAALDRLVMACIAREREHRPATLDELIAELEPFATEESFRALLSGSARQVPVVVGRPMTRLHRDGAVLIPPTMLPGGSRPHSAPELLRAASLPPVTPRPSLPFAPAVQTSEPLASMEPSEPAAPSTSPVQGAGKTRRVLVPAALAALVLAIGAGGAVLFSRVRGVDATAAGYEAPPLPAVRRDVPATASDAPVPPAGAGASAHPSGGARTALPSGLAEPVTAPRTPPAGAPGPKPARVWLPRRPAPAAAGGTAAPAAQKQPASDPFFRAGRAPDSSEFK